MKTFFNFKKIDNLQMATLIKSERDNKYYLKIRFCL